MEKKNANKVVWVEYWIEHMDQSKESAAIDAKKDENGHYVCEIALPVNDYYVRVKNSSHVDAILNAAEKASEYIEEFSKQNPDMRIHNPYEKYDYEIYVDENDNLFIEMTSECRRRIGNELQEAQTKAMDAVNKAIDELQKVYGLTDQLYLHITSKDIYDKSMKIEDIWQLQEMEIEKNTDRVFVPVMSYEKDKYVVTLAHLGERVD